ncbi:MAG: EAL domain-containing protein [Zoogloea sp.]|nr:EAL domain-containing protein [Zoogloea sp.]
MSLLRQLWISVAVAMAVVLVGTFVVSVMSARSYFEQQLLAQGNDGAISLGLSMSQQPKDLATAELMVSALFDGGHYSLVRFSDTAGRTVVERVQPELADNVPGWFVTLVPLHAKPGQAMVSDGWRQAGQVTVIAATRYAYQSLWSGTLQSGGVLVGAGFLWALGIGALFRWVQRPLVEMTEQADAIGEGRFLTIPEPKVIELRSMARALNRMSHRVRSLFREQATRIEGLRDDASRDVVTGLHNRAFLMGELRRMLSDSSAPSSGCVILFRTTDLLALNKRLGRERTDGWLRNVADILRQVIGGQTDTTVARMNGADYACLLPDVSPQLAKEFAERAIAGVAACDAEGQQPDADMRLSAAVAGYLRDETPSAVLARADTALMRAEMGQVGVAEVVTEGGPVLGEQAWAERLRDALARNSFRLVFYPVLRPDGTVLHREAMLRLIGEDGSSVAAGQFMPAAQRVGLVSACDLAAVGLALQTLRDAPGEVAVNISPRSLLDPEFLTRLGRMLEAAGESTWRLSMEVSERGLDTHLTGMEALAEVLGRFGCTLGVEHFGRQLAALPKLYALRLGYLKIDGTFIAGLEQNEGHQRLVKAIVDVARGLDISVYAEQVHTASEWTAAENLGILGMTGPEATRRAG